jgi:hypothetical protein
MGYNPTEKAACMGMYDADGKFIGKGEKACCKDKEKAKAPEKKACCKDNPKM